MPKRLGLILLLYPLSMHASFIESTIGTAIVEDATASYFNPGALGFLKNKQFIGLSAQGNTKTTFTGQTTQIVPNLTQTGSTSIHANYWLPSFYYAMPIKSKWVLGLAVIANDFDRELEGFSILRYSCYAHGLAV